MPFLEQASAVNSLGERGGVRQGAIDASALWVARRVCVRQLYSVRTNGQLCFLNTRNGCAEQDSSGIASLQSPAQGIYNSELMLQHCAFPDGIGIIFRD